MIIMHNDDDNDDDDDDINDMKLIYKYPSIRKSSLSNAAISL